MQIHHTIGIPFALGIEEEVSVMKQLSDFLGIIIFTVWDGLDSDE